MLLCRVFIIMCVMKPGSAHVPRPLMKTPTQFLHQRSYQPCSGCYCHLLNCFPLFSFAFLCYHLLSFNFLCFSLFRVSCLPCFPSLAFPFLPFCSTSLFSPAIFFAFLLVSLIFLNHPCFYFPFLSLSCFFPLCSFTSPFLLFFHFIFIPLTLSSPSFISLFFSFHLLVSSVFFFLVPLLLSLSVLFFLSFFSHFLMSSFLSFLFLSSPLLASSFLTLQSCLLQTSV